MTDIWIVFAIIAAIVVLFAWDRLPVIAVCMGAALALWATGILTLQQSLAGFGDPAVIFIAALFVVSAGLEVAGVTAWAGQLLIRQAGNSRTRLIVLMMGFVGVLAALISVNGAVAALLPVVVVMAIRLGRAPSQLLMPLVFGAHAGSQLHADRQPGQRAGGRGLGECGRAGLRLFRIRAGRHSDRDRLRRHRRAVRRTPAAQPHQQDPAARPQPARHHAGRAVPAVQRRAPAARARGIAPDRDGPRRRSTSPTAAS